jgi:hypothetical protein
LFGHQNDDKAQNGKLGVKQQHALEGMVQYEKRMYTAQNPWQSWMYYMLLSLPPQKGGQELEERFTQLWEVKETCAL